MYKIVYFDTETTGLPEEGSGIDSQPHLLSASIVVDFYNGKTGEVVEGEKYEVYNKDAGQYLTEHAMKVNGITLDELEAKGIPLSEVIEKLLASFKDTTVIICHNTKFDMQILWYTALRTRNSDLIRTILNVRSFCTSINSRLYSINNKGGKHMKLVEVFKVLFGVEFDGQHNALADTIALRDITRKLVNMGEIRRNKLTDSSKYSYINISKNEDGTFNSEVSKIDIKTVHPIFSKQTCNESLDDMVRSICEFADDSVILFFSNKESLDSFTNLINRSNTKTIFGFRLATYIGIEDTNTSEMISEHKKDGRKIKNPFTLLKDNGIFYR